MDAGTLELVELDEALDFEPRCESVIHDESDYHQGHAAYLQLGRCEHSVGLRCAASVDMMRSSPNFCWQCGADGPLTWTPIKQLRRSIRPNGGPDGQTY